MSIISFSELSQSFGHFDIFAGITGRIEHDSRIGLVGPNGVGKTSLIHILAGIEPPPTGTLSVKRGLTVGYLRQEAIEAFADHEANLYDSMLEVFTPIRAMEDELRALEHQMAEDASEGVLTAYGDLLDVFEARGGYDYELRIEQTLTGLGFGIDDFFTPVRKLSGGQKTRALLARLLLEQPDLLILDEPTNHLDIEAITWLEGLLGRWPKAVLIVSHDRRFLDQTVNTIWVMTPFGIEPYKGNYSAYVKQREEREARAMDLYEAEMERMWKEFDFIKRFKKDGDSQAIGRLRRLTRDLVAIDQLGLVQYLGYKKWSDTGIGNIRMFTVAEAEAALKAIEAPVVRTPFLKMRLADGGRSGERVLSLHKLTVGYPGRPLLTADDLHVYRGQIVALTGPNGAGKTTLLRTLLDELPALSGRFSFGHNVKVGYFAQAHESLNPEQSVLDSLIAAGGAIGKAIGLREARTRLGTYLFRGDDVFKRVGDLSGGERARVALAMLALHGANLLLLDEPTNHLDIQAQEALQDVLQAFEGTIMLVSHDRYLVDTLATHVWQIENGAVTVREAERALA
ncbi:MAG: ABC-F family ATP-binding cassette domain-containing protein [Anaerolineae bacterium]|nr:MAG: putative ABC transporter ATP-binding protein [Chloroflexi bacterium OLB13]MBW7878097.1 ABC-F family ATP-binding cassette domain-containing protein [Anaerolineae bacterium]MCO6444015.1 ABC-F family ATP-binding cassette domain-containing protein [Anaerolineae bacterium]